jgi:hypothetical protein
MSGLQFNSNASGGVQTSLTGRSRSQSAGHGFGTNTILTVYRSNLAHEVEVNLETGDIRTYMDAAAGKENLEESGFSSEEKPTG